jgi:adenylyl cyclase-associated protein
MASFEVVNCQRVNVICREAVPAVAIDKTDGIVVFLPQSSLTTEVVASKSSEMNMQWNDENGELIERPIPEQYVHRIKGPTVTADVSDLYGH